MATCHAEASVELPLTVDQAWAAVVDWDSQSRWMLLTTVRGTEQRGVGVGGGVSARTAVGPVGFTDDMVITEWDPPSVCRVRHLGRLVRGEGGFVVSEAPGGSRFTWSEDVVPPLGRLGALAGLLAWRLVRPGIELMMRVSLRRLAREVSR